MRDARRPDEICSERLRMRRLRSDDIAGIHGIMPDPKTMRFWSTCLRVIAKCGFQESGRASATYLVDGQACDSVFLKLELKRS